MWIGNIDFRKDTVEGPSMLNRRTAMGHNNKGSFTPEKVDEQLEKGVDRKGLYEVAR